MVRFLSLIRVLSQENVDFVLVGGVAAVVHGASHVRQVMGICYSRAGSNLEKLCQALTPFAPRLRDAPRNHPFVLNGPTLMTGSHFALITSAGALDLLAEVSGLGDYSRVNRYAESLKIEGAPCRVLSLEGLILSKKASQRTRDRLLLPELEALLAMRKKQSSSASGSRAQ